MLIHSANNGADLPPLIQAYFQARALHRQAIGLELFVWQKDIMACINMRWIVFHLAIHGVRPPWNL